MGLTDIKKELKKLDKNKLIELFAELYKKNNSVKEFLIYYVNPDEKELLERYRNKVFEAFYPKRGNQLKFKEGKQAIGDFKKLGVSPELLADLMLFYVEAGVSFTNDFGDIDEAFYSSLENTFHAALKLMKKDNLLEKFVDRARQVVSDSDRIGWGFHYYLLEAYEHFFDDFYKVQPANRTENNLQETGGKIIKLGRP